MSIRPPGKWSTLLLTLVLTTLVSVPATVWASHQFTDVPDSYIFHNAIGWMKDNGITVGCNPPANTKYCPGNNVTRGEMAAFMKRLAENQVVDAGSVDGLDSSDLLTSDLIVLGSPSTAWTANGGAPPSSVTIFTNSATVSGDGVMQMPLLTPIQIGGVGYGLVHMDVCYQAISPGYITSLSIYREVGSGLAASVFTDGTDRTSATFKCQGIDPKLFPEDGLTLVVGLAGGGSVKLASVLTVWSSDLTALSGESSGNAEPGPGDAP
jgi:hypothetical protein